VKLKNYTSSVPVALTVARIEGILAAIGAKAIGKNYEQGKLVSITFQLEMNGADHLVRLPADPVSVYTILRAECKRPRQGAIQRIQEQSERTAWKIQQDWLEVELAQIRLRQKDPLQAFLPYVWDGTQTFYQRLKNSKFTPLLPERTSS
jgi:hypothetical protein